MNRASTKKSSPKRRPPSELRAIFGARVRQLRESTELSQEAFAIQSGIARSYMSRLERGRANPSLDAIYALASELGVDVIDLFKQDK